MVYDLGRYRDAINREWIAATQAQRVALNLSQYDFINQWPAANYSGDDDAEGRVRSMAAHPAGKGRDNQPDFEDLLRKAVADNEPLPEFEDRLFEVLFELAELIREARDA